MLFKNSSMDLVKGSKKDIIIKMIRFTLPIIFIGLFQILYNAFDLIIIQNHDGPISAAAVGANGSLIALITSGFLGLSNGVNVVMARYYGRNDQFNCDKTLHTSIALSLIGGIFVGIFGITLSRLFLELIRVDQSYIELTNTYLIIYFLGLPFLSIYNFSTAILRGMGNSKTPLIILMISGSINVILNLIFVNVYNLGVKGVAFATVISEFISALLVVMFLIKSNSFVNLKISEVRLHQDSLKQILKIGIPSGLEGIIFSISNVLLQSSVNTWGPKVVAANSDASSIESFTFVAMYAVSSTATAFTSANYGRGYKKNIKTIFYTCIILCVLISLVFGSITLIFKEQLLDLYIGNNVDETIKKLAYERMVIILSTYYLCGIMNVLCGILRGLGYSISPLMITIGACCVFRLFWDIYVYSDNIESSRHSLKLLYSCYPLSWIIACIGEIILYLSLKNKYNKKMDDNYQRYISANI